MSDDKIDIIHHLADSNVLEFSILSVDVTVPLPHFELFGMDLSITKHVVMMWLATTLMVAIFPLICNRKSLVPTGFRNFFEAILLFLRDDVVRTNIGKEDGDRFLPYLWTLFFFILFCNLLGLIPFGATATGNFSVAVGLALISFVVIHLAGIQKNGLKHYLESIVPPVPKALWPLMLVVEVLGHLIKPAALAIRLFANMSAGHVVLLAFLGFIFTFKNIPVIGISVLAACAVNMLEIFVAFLQAYIFVFLTSVFIGMSVHPQH